MKTQARNSSRADLYRQLPSLDELLRDPAVARLIERAGRPAAAEAARAALSVLRLQICSNSLTQSGLLRAIANLPALVEREMEAFQRYRLRPVINATGVVLHTNLGRAPLAEEAVQHIQDVSRRYSNLEFDLESGQRGKRDDHVERLFQRLLGGAHADSPVSTIVVNNNAAAVLLALNTLAEGGEVIVSRGELVEIGESFRIPDVMSKSNAVLREVGSTNRTHLADYERAIDEGTRLLLRVHRSNFEITGFTHQPPLEDLVELARKKGLPLMEDLGSGAYFDLHAAGIQAEATVTNRLRAGVDVVTYSGDKLLGGPQAGILSGRSDLIARMRANSLFRALRVDKLTYAALEATLLAYVKQDYDAIPTLRMIRTTQDEVGKRAETLTASVHSSGLGMELVDGESIIGGGAAPSAVLPTRLVALRRDGLTTDELLARLRTGDPPVIARVEGDRVLLDLRTVFPDQDQILAGAITRAAMPAKQETTVQDDVKS